MVQSFASANEIHSGVILGYPHHRDSSASYPLSRLTPDGPECTIDETDFQVAGYRKDTTVELVEKGSSEQPAGRGKDKKYKQIKLQAGYTESSSVCACPPYDLAVGCSLFFAERTTQSEIRQYPSGPKGKYCDMCRP